MIKGLRTHPQRKSNAFNASLLTVAIAGALGLGLSQTASAEGQYLQKPVDLGDLSVVQISTTQDTSSKSDAVVYGTLIDENFSSTLNVNAQFDAADLNAVHSAGFENFGKLDVDNFDVSYLNGALLFSSKDEAVRVQDASITVNASGIDDRPYIEVAGVTQYNGAIEFSGSSTTISASSSLQIDPDEESIVYGYEIENPLGSADNKRTATFSADRTTISAASTGSDGVGVIGVFFSADAVDNPQISFARGETAVTATNETADKWAYGVFMHNSDGNQPGSNGAITVAEGASLSITSRGGDAIGLYADDGVFTSNGTLSISAEGTGTVLAAGIYAAGNANLNFNGRTDVTAQGDEAYALYVKYAEKIPEGQQTSDDAENFPSRDNFGVTFGSDSITTLNGAVYVDKDMDVTMNGAMTVNGDFEVVGTMTGTGALAINGQKAEYGAEMEGAFVREDAELTVDTLTLGNVDFTNYGEVNANSVTLNQGAVVSNLQGFHAPKMILNAGSRYVEWLTLMMKMMPPNSIQGLSRSTATFWSLRVVNSAPCPNRTARRWKLRASSFCLTPAAMPKMTIRRFVLKPANTRLTPLKSTHLFLAMTKVRAFR